VLFSPADVDLVGGAPSSRRRYLDILLALSSRPYLAALQRYRAALAQRNAALRETMRATGARAEHRVAVWEAPLAEHGAVLWRERVAWSERAAGRFAALCAAIGEQSAVAMRYATSLEPSSMGLHDVADALARALEQKRGLDVRRGITHAGPHRDDLALTLDGRELRAFGSAGQQRTAAIALRLLEAETLHERLGAAPLFLLDDPFAELDARRSSRILDLLAEQGMGQTLLTVPRASDIPPALSSLARWRIAAGVVSHDDAHAGAA
jgi:DNA replication and repair protein RecF